MVRVSSEPLPRGCSWFSDVFPNHLNTSLLFVLLGFSLSLPCCRVFYLSILALFWLDCSWEYGGVCWSPGSFKVPLDSLAESAVLYVCGHKSGIRLLQSTVPSNPRFCGALGPPPPPAAGEGQPGAHVWGAGAQTGEQCRGPRKPCRNSRMGP